jgi:hypothetical protein
MHYMHSEAISGGHETGQASQVFQEESLEMS